MKHWRSFDWWLVILPVALTTFGTLMLFAISRWAVGVPHSTPVKQALYLVGGIVLFWVMTNVDYKLIGKLAWPLYLVCLGSLAAVTVIGHSSLGAQRWINLGVIQFEPSEPAKLIVALTLAKFLSDREDSMGRVTTLLGSLLIAGIPALFVLRQPDFGTAMVIGAVWLAAMLMASTPVVYLATVFAATAIATPLAWAKVLKPFQKKRLTSFLDPNSDPLNSGWNIIHARIAVGSGGFLGQWFSRATQSRLSFLSAPDKDFIFSVIAEQVGFVGILVLFGVYGAFLMRIARVAFMSADTFGRLLSVGILAMFLFQTFVNIGMNIGIMPVTGIPLPLLSYGGSSLLTSFIALGILESVLLRHQKLIFSRGQSII